MDDDIKKLYSLQYEPKSKIATLIWHEQVDSRQLREINERLVEFIIQHNVEKMINVVHYSHSISPEDQKWLVEDLIPRMYEAGLRYSAVIVPQNVITRYIIDRVVDQLNPSEIQTRFFSTTVRALDWLKHI